MDGFTEVNLHKSQCSDEATHGGLERSTSCVKHKL